MELSWLAIRLFLAFVFLVAGATKLVDPIGSRQALRDFGLPLALARPLVVLLPLLETAVAVVLVPSTLAWYGAWGALALLTVFSIAVAIAMARGRQPDCHCFGQLHPEPVGWPTLLRNVGLAGCAGWLLAGGQRQLGPDLWSWFLSLGTQQRKVAVIAACALGFLFFLLVDRSRPKPVVQEPEALLPTEEDDAPPERSPSPQRTEPPARPRKVIAGIGLPIGTPAPEFELPQITGEKRSLQQLLAQYRDILLIFTSPYCEPCQALTPMLARWTREMPGLPKVVLISRGAVKDNLARLKESGSFPVLLQEDFEIAEAYDTSSTPTAVLVRADGVIGSDLATGAIAIKQLFSLCGKPPESGAENASHAVGNTSIPL